MTQNKSNYSSYGVACFHIHGDIGFLHIRTLGNCLMILMETVLVSMGNNLVQMTSVKKVEQKNFANVDAHIFVLDRLAFLYGVTLSGSDFVTASENCFLFFGSTNINCKIVKRQLLYVCFFYTIKKSKKFFKISFIHYVFCFQPLGLALQRK
jgi:hypothetical protein